MFLPCVRPVAGFVGQPRPVGRVARFHTITRKNGKDTAPNYSRCDLRRKKAPPDVAVGQGTKESDDPLPRALKIRGARRARCLSDRQT